MIDEKINSISAPVVAAIRNAVFRFLDIEGVWLKELFEAVIKPWVNTAQIVGILFPVLEICL